MDQPTSRIRSPWRTWLDPVQNNLLLGVSFWLGLAVIAALLLYSGYNALVGADRHNLGYAVLGFAAVQILFGRPFWVAPPVSPPRPWAR